MQLMGWDLSFYKNGVAPIWMEGVTPEMLIDLAGNAWSAFSVAPIIISSMGCAPWEYYKKASPPRKPSGSREFVDSSGDDSLSSD